MFPGKIIDDNVVLLCVAIPPLVWEFDISSWSNRSSSPALAHTCRSPIPDVYELV